MSNSKQQFLRTLDRPIAFQRSFVRLTGSITAALMLSQAIYWSLRSQSGDGWFWKTMQGWEEETGLTRREQDSARAVLRKLGVLSEEKRGQPAKIWFRVDEEKLASSLAETANLAWRKAPTKYGEKRQPEMAESAKLYSESTSETTKQKHPHSPQGGSKETIPDGGWKPVPRRFLRRRSRDGPPDAVFAYQGPGMDEDTIRELRQRADEREHQGAVGR